MSIHSEYTRLVNKYLDGDMLGSEKEIFEEQLSMDPMLKTEFDHQNEIVNGLKEYRKAQLKARLDNVSVTPGILGVISQSVSMKTLTYVVTSILIGTGVYYYFNSETLTNFQLTGVESKRDFVDSNNEIEQIKKILDYRYDGSTTPLSWIEQKFTQPKIEVSESNHANNISFEVPEVSDDQAVDMGAQPEQILEKVINRNTSFAGVAKLDKVDIENVVTNRYKFHYKLENNKLFLYGKFEASPYEILEINSFQSKKLFFFYNGNYFRLMQDVQEISPLIKITNQAVIQELNIIKSKDKL